MSIGDEEAERDRQRSEKKRRGRWEDATRYAAAHGLLKVLERGKEQTSWADVRARSALADILHKAQRGDSPETRRLARKLWIQASGLSKPGPRNEDTAWILTWMRPVIDSSDPSAELQTLLDGEQYLDSETEKGRKFLLHLKRANEQVKGVPVTLKREAFAGLKPGAIFAILEAIMATDARRFAVRIGRPGDALRKLYERAKPKKRPKKRIARSTLKRS